MAELMDDIDFYLSDFPPHIASQLKVGDEVRICDETGKQIATGTVVETYDGGATLKTIPNGNGG